MKNKIYKRVLAVLTSAALAFAPFVSFPQTVYAATNVNALNQIRFTMPYGSGDYIITGNITGVTGISISGNVNIDLNGHKISGSSFAGPLFKVGSGYTLTISDSKGGGSIVNENNQEAVGCYGGTLNISGGTFSGVKYGVKMTDGTLNISGGTVKGDADAIYVQKGTLNMSGGKVQTTCDTGCALYMADGKAEITGGSLASSGAYATAVTLKKGSLNISKASIKCTGAHAYGLIAEGGNAHIADGKIKVSGPLSTGIGIRSGSTVAISGGSILSTNRGIVATGSSASTPASLDISGGKIKVTGAYGNAVILNKNVDVSVTAGTFTTPNGYPEFLTKKNTTGNIYVSKKAGKTIHMVQRYSEDDFSYFADNGTVYKRDMLVTDANDLYSAINSAASSLTSSIKLTVDRATLDVFDKYSAEWFFDKADDFVVDVEAYMEADQSDDVYSVIFDDAVSSAAGSEDPSVYITDDTIPDFGFLEETTESDDSSEYALTIKPKYTMFYETEMLLAKKAKKTAASIEAQESAISIRKILKSTVKSSMSDKDKIKAVHDYMVKSYSYDFGNAEESSGFYGPLTTGQAVSTGYSELFCLFMTTLGIDAGTVTGYNTQNIGTRILHTWNSVTLDGNVYYVDVTWDDSTDSSDYYMKSEDEFYKDGYHVPLS